jgi:hypothetical protein
MRKVWLVTAKLLKRMVNQNICVEFPLCGKFQKRDGVVAFMPSLDFVESGHFKFPVNE